MHDPNPWGRPFSSDSINTAGFLLMCRLLVKPAKLKNQAEKIFEQHRDDYRHGSKGLKLNSGLKFRVISILTGRLFRVACFRSVLLVTDVARRLRVTLSGTLGRSEHRLSACTLTEVALSYAKKLRCHHRKDGNDGEVSFKAAEHPPGH